MKTLAFALVLACSFCSLAQETPSKPPAQNQRPGRGAGMTGRGVGGTILSVSGDSITLTTRNGATATVKTTPDTRFMREGEAAKLADFKVGDRVMAIGEASGENTWTAQMVGTFARRGDGPQDGQGAPVMMERMREGMGKEFVAGEVKSMEGTKLTVHGPDGKDYTAEVDENTSFRRGRDSITFPEIKVGDRVMGRGKINDSGVFVFENLNVGGLFRETNGDRGQGDPVRTAPPKQ